MIDIHCHLSEENFKDIRNSLKEKINEYKNKLKAIIDSALNLKSAIISLELSEKHKNFIFTTIGFYPTDAFKCSEKEIENYIEFISKNKDKIVGIGEIGLDYYLVKESTKIEKQKEVLKRFIELANDLKKPIILHSRMANEDVLKIIIDNDVKKAVFHFFNGKIKTAKRITEEGYFISVNNQIYKNFTIQNVVKEIDTQFLMTETDSPWCGIDTKINEPTNVKICIEEISKIKKCEFSEVEKIIDLNIINFFNLNL